MTVEDNTAGAPPPDEPSPFVETVEATPPRPRKQQHRAPAPSTKTDVEKEIDLADAAALSDQLLELSGDAPIKITISRKAPRFGANGENVQGVLETVEEPIDHDYIRETWGGGTFSIMIQQQKGDGRYKIWRRLQLKLAGPPKMHGEPTGAAAHTAPASSTMGRDPLVMKAFDTMAEREQAAQQRMHDLEERGRQQQAPAFDPRMLETATGPYVEQVRVLMETVRDLQTKLADQANKPPPRDEFRDTLMQQVIAGDRSEAERVRKLYEDRLETQRDRYESRIDQMIRDHRDDLKRAEDRAADALRAAEARHERELRLAEKQSDMGKDNAKSAFETRIENYKETIARLERELATAASKIGTLEAKKDQSIADKANELLSVQEALEGLGGGAGEKDEKWWSKALDVLGNSEAAMAVVNKLTGGSPEQQQQQVIVQQPQQQQLPPPGVPWQGPDGNVYVRDGAGNIHQLDPAKVQAAQARLRKKQKKAKKAARAAAKAAANGQPAPDAEPVDDGDPAAAELEDLVADAAEGGDDADDADDAAPARVPTGRPPDATELKAALLFMENAIKGNAPPESFARGAASMVPADVLTWITSFESIDDFLGLVKLQAGSPLTTVAGRRFARAVHKILRDGTS